MWPYILCFSISCFFTQKASKCNRKNRKRGYIFFSVLAILLPCFLSAVRDSGIGTDVSVYGDTIFDRSLRMPFKDYITYRGGEYLYLLVVYLCSHSIGTLEFQYLVLQALSIVPVYCTLQRDKGNRYAWFGMLVYYFMLFPYSLNLMRQSIAISVLFWGFRYVEERKFLKYIITVIIATMFHTTGVIGIAVYPIYILMHSERKNLDMTRWYKKNAHLLIAKVANKFGWLISWLVIALTIFMLTQFSKIITFLYLYSTKDYSHFYNQIQTTSGSPIIVEYILLTLPVFFMYLINKKYYDRAETGLRPLFTLSAMGIILYQAARISAETYRISLYFHIFFPMFIIRLLAFKKNIKERFVWICIFTICILIFWDLFFVKKEWCQIYPYTSKLLGIN